MIKEIALPHDTQMTSPPPLELRNLMAHALVMIPLSNQVQMIRHQGAKPDKKPACGLGLRKTVSDASTDIIASQQQRTRTAAANGHKPEITPINPGRNGMRQLLPHWIHARRLLLRLDVLRQGIPQTNDEVF